MQVSIGAYAICNGTFAGGVAIGNARVQMDRAIDLVVPIRALNPELFDRVARKITFTFEVERVHASAAAAELFILDLDGNLPSSGTVKLTPTGSVSYRYIPNGRVLSHVSEHMGSKTKTQYIIVGGQPSSSA
jgi:hypothetical protein